MTESNQQNENEVIVVEEIDIELFLQENRPVVKAHRYLIRLDKEKLVVHHHTITGKEILALVGKTPDKWKLYQHKR